VFNNCNHGYGGVVVSNGDPQVERQQMKVIIAGSRQLDCPQLVAHYLENVMKMQEQISTVISGHAVGIDRCGETWAAKHSIPFEIFLPNWTVGKQAGLLRNRQMAEVADAAIIFWDGKSTGAQHMYSTMLKLTKPAIIYKVNKIVADSAILGSTVTSYNVEGDWFVETYFN
jgi:hypothetical protein